MDFSAGPCTAFGVVTMRSFSVSFECSLGVGNTGALKDGVGGAFEIIVAISLACFF